MLLKFHTRTYKSQAEKWSVATACLNLLHKFIVDYRPASEDFNHNNSQVCLSSNWLTFIA